MRALAQRIDRELRSSGTPERASHERRYLKSELRHYGAGVPEIRRIARTAYRDNAALGRAQVLELVDILWSKPVHERRMASVELLRFYEGQVGPRDLPLIERLLRESKTWALVDELATKVAGGLVERHPELASHLDRWSVDEDFWIRRASMLALLVPLRRGGGDFQRFAGYASSMIGEKEFFIRKAIGWVLREVSKTRPELVWDWLAPRTDRASGVTVREAVKYLEPGRRQALEAAYKSRRPAV